MFRNLRVKTEPVRHGPEPGSIPVTQLIGDASLPVSIQAINSLPENAKLRLYRALVPIELLAAVAVNPRTWKDAQGVPRVALEAEEGGGKLRLFAWAGEDPEDIFFDLELSDNAFNGIDLNFLILNDPAAEKFGIDRDEQGRATHFGAVHRNLPEEARAMQAGLAPGQVRAGLALSRQVFARLEAFLTTMAHHAYYLEPVSYVSAWVFERRGFAYVTGHKLMEQIHTEFQPGGALQKALDDSTLFRGPEQAAGIRGRAWAIHDGILATLEKRWDGLRMVKQIGRPAGVNTAPDVPY
ncbi:MAG: hypothetical protein HYZ26_00150 [Chloroflexi bacterium]|nr:hypothetical protein [Chloroflexota bacterium]